MGPRLRAVLDLVPAGGAVAEIGAGDAQVGLALAAAGRRVIVSEKAAGAFARLPASLERRLGDGLEVLAPGEVAGVVIAGLGGAGIAAMLERGAAVARGLRWLVLQPQQRPERLLGYLSAAGYRVLAERTAAQGRHSYRVLLVAPPDEHP